jgi:hypothetical protein
LRGPVGERCLSFGTFYRLLIRADTSRPFEPGNAAWRM